MVPLARGAQPKVTVVLVNWNGLELTMRCLESLRGTYANLRFVVVDNGSSDGSAAALRRIADVHLIENASNLGFAPAANQGMSHALQDDAEYVLVLNNDTKGDPNLVAELVETAKAHHDKATIVPRIYFLSRPDTLWFLYGTANLWLGTFSNPAHGRTDRNTLQTSISMDFAVGCCLLIPRPVLVATGLFDGSFFMYCEDLDWSLRTRARGFSIASSPAARLWHDVSSSGKKAPVHRRYLMTRNHIWVMRRHASPLQKATFALLLPLRSVIRILRGVGRGWWALAAAEMRGVRDGWRRLPS